MQCTVSAALRRCHHAAVAGLLASLPACINFHAVEEGRVYRAGQPTAAQLEGWIERYGIRTVLRLRGGADEDAAYASVGGLARSRGVEFVLAPMTASGYPTKRQLLLLWDTFANAEYPVLIHCRAGADRSGLAAALYVLQRTGDLDRARGELALLPYGHTGLSGTWRLDDVLDQYEPWAGTLSFPDWVRLHYEPPGRHDEAERTDPAPAR
jgi:uncharacterized protein (TIGR01244 family)